MAHCVNPAAEEMLDKEVRVLDKGFVRLVDYLGGDDRIVQAARVSYGSGTKTVREDKKLIAYLLRNEHMSPFEQVVFTFHVKMPIFVARQWVRHRTARINEISGRYSVMEDEFYVPEPGYVSFQSESNKQGRAKDAVPAKLAEETVAALEESYRFAYERYDHMIKENISREIARINLPLSLYTQMYWQIDLRNLFNFLRLRLDAHAQAEIREYAKILAGVVKSVSPYAWEAFEEHDLHAKKLSRTQLEVLRNRLREKDPTLLEELGIG
jgi:thymidylate synthase (FAD)